MGTSIYSTIRFGTGSVRTGIALCFPFLLLYGLGLPSGFLSCYYTVWDCLLVSVLSTILVWDCFPYRVLYWFQTGSVSSRECPATVFKKLRSRREALSFTKSIPVLL